MHTIPDTLPERPTLADGAWAITDSWHPDVCILWAPFPIDKINQTLKSLGRGWKKAVIDAVLGSRVGAAAFVVRTAETLSALRAKFTPVAAAGSGLQAWLNGPDVGTSSRFMARKLLGPQPNLTKPGDWRDEDDAYPKDAGDFGRCLSLLNAVPELRPRIGEMAAVSPEWAHVVAVWERAEAVRDDYEACTKLIEVPRV